MPEVSREPSRSSTSGLMRGPTETSRPDERPWGGGEFFGARPIGSEFNLTCFQCGADDLNPQRRAEAKYVPLVHNIAGFVRTKAAGERVVAMFEEGGARLDYRQHEPNWIQVKIGACDEHLESLIYLRQLTIEAKGVITQEMIVKVQATPSI